MLKKYGTTAWLILMGLAYANVGVQALLNPEGIMSFVDVKLENPSAMSSIRAYYGAVNLFFGLFLAIVSFNLKKEGLILVVLYTMGFVVGRSFSLAVDGMPNEFVTNWLFTEAFSGAVSIWLLLREIKFKPQALVQGASA